MEFNADGMVERRAELTERIAEAHFPGFADLACRNPFGLAELCSDEVDVEVVPYSDGIVTEGSGYTGLCVRDTNPVLIKIAAGRNQRRKNFTLMHEFGHFLQRYSDEIDGTPIELEKAMCLTMEHGEDYEERVCDAFASRTLLPDGLVDLLVVGSPDAQDAARLFMSCRGSREVVARRILESMGGGSFISVIYRNGRVGSRRYSDGTVEHGRSMNAWERFAVSSLDKGHDDYWAEKDHVMPGPDGPDIADVSAAEAVDVLDGTKCRFVVVRRHPCRSTPPGSSVSSPAAWPVGPVEAIVLDVDETGRPIDVLRGVEADAYRRVASGSRKAILVYEDSKTYRIVLSRDGVRDAHDGPCRMAALYGRAVDVDGDRLARSLRSDFDRDNRRFREPVPLHDADDGTPGPATACAPTPAERTAWRLLSENSFVCNPDLDAVRNAGIYVDAGGDSPTRHEYDLVERVLAAPDRDRIIRGCAGTGKTFVIRMLADLLSRPPYGKKVAVAVKDNLVEACRRNIATPDGRVTVGTFSEISCGRDHYDVVLVDEAHRLRRRYAKTKFLHSRLWKVCEETGADNELDLMRSAADSVVLMYDPLQTLRPDDILPRTLAEATRGWEQDRLVHQVRINPDSAFDPHLGDDYVSGLIDFLGYPKGMRPNPDYDRSVFTEYRDMSDRDEAYFGVCDSIQELFDYIDLMGNLHPGTINRVVAGYTRKWESRKNPEAYDWVEGDHHWKWNSTFEGWVNPVRSDSEKARDLADRYHDEIGCVHSVQGEDLDYVGVIVGKDLGIDEDGDLVGVRANYFDKNGIPAKDDFDQDTFTRFIKNNYFTLMTRGVAGIRVFFEDPAMRERFESLMNEG